LTAALVGVAMRNANEHFRQMGLICGLWLSK